MASGGQQRRCQRAPQERTDVLVSTHHFSITRYADNREVTMTARKTRDFELLERIARFVTPGQYASRKREFRRFKPRRQISCQKDPQSCSQHSALHFEHWPVSLCSCYPCGL